MATVTLVTDKATYNVGDTITASYVVVGADPHPETISGTLTVDGQSVTVPQVTVEVAHNVVYATPTAPGLTFTAVPGQPGVYTATAA